MTSKPKPPPVASPRACAVCGARLSSYNENPTCWAHTLELPWKGPSTRPR